MSDQLRLIRVWNDNTQKNPQLEYIFESANGKHEATVYHDETQPNSPADRDDVSYKRDGLRTRSGLTPELLQSINTQLAEFRSTPFLTRFRRGAQEALAKQKVLAPIEENQCIRGTKTYKPCYDSTHMHEPGHTPPPKHNVVIDAAPIGGRAVQLGQDGLARDYDGNGRADLATVTVDGVQLVIDTAKAEHTLSNSSQDCFTINPNVNADIAGALALFDVAFMELAKPGEQIMPKAIPATVTSVSVDNTSIPFVRLASIHPALPQLALNADIMLHENKFQKTARAVLNNVQTGFRYFRDGVAQFSELSGQIQIMREALPQLEAEAAEQRAGTHNPNCRTDHIAEYNEKKQRVQQAQDALTALKQHTAKSKQR